MYFEEKLQEVERRISDACKRSGRDRRDITLVAVSKTKPVSDIRAFYELGIRQFGENRPQELRDKTGALPDDVSWHMIGHLQRNKVKYVVGRATLIHSVDSPAIAEAISAESLKRDMTTDILIEVNVAGEESKFGISPKACPTLVRTVSKLPNLRIRGLMTIAPFVEDPEENRGVFSVLKQLSVDIASENIDNITMDVLSMGMTNDYEVAIEEGSTIVRIGTALFGERNLLL